MINYIVYISLFYLLLKNKKESFDYKIKNSLNKIYFMNKQEAQIFFIKDNDGYIKSLTPIDLKAVGAQTKQEIINRLIQASSDFTLEEKNKLEKASEKADQFLYNFNNINQTYFPYFDNKKCSLLDWKFIKTIGNINEEGLPHTREDIIFLNDKVIKNSKENELIYILIHEKVHIYQRLFPNEIKQLFYKLGFKPNSYLKDHILARSNPDVDGIVYENKNGKLMLAKYNSYNPKNLFDASYPEANNDSSEHPNESMAYFIDGIQRNICNSDPNNSYCHFN